MVLLRPAETGRAAGFVGEFPEEVGGVGVGVAGCRGADAWVDADEEGDEVGGERVG